MNYCPACQRHLNGALACAGCGTAAEYLVPLAPTAASPGPAPQPPLAEVFADSLVVLSGPAEGGRAGTRRRADAQRRTRRTVLSVGLGLVLAAGGSIAVARIVSDGEGVDRAAEVVLTDDAGPKQPDPLPSDGPAAPSALPSAKAGGGAAKKAGPGAATGTATAGPGASASASGKAGPSQSATAGGGAVQPPKSGQPAPGPTGTAKPGQTPQPTPTKAKPGKPKPTPSPTETCVFWIFC
ncbi:hypothetical protein OOK31_29965 [Streptomyces sp. NBC_00249]|uniref:SCO2400 family protein n=1 Tax=Streptomyces sp. NBC_00249 TaxID=2975690 RepID=UPI00224E10D8|nr:hypothetical protein [Streptomyces sp. NBC_00249]MCX5198071.1 hypothetical protein [Streptomyces sp. NBC_00249]